MKKGKEEAKKRKKKKEEEEEREEEKRRDVKIFNIPYSVCFLKFIVTNDAMRCTAVTFDV